MTPPLCAAAFRCPALTAAAAFVMLLTTATAHAQDEPDGKWHGGITIGGAFASGNSASRVLTGTADAAVATTIDKISLYGNVNYGRSDIDGIRTTTSDQVRLGGRYDYNLSESLFLFGGANAETNKVAGLKSRYGINTGAGYKIIRTAETTFDVFAGVGYSKVKFTDDSSANGAELMIGEESTHKLSDTTTFKQRLEFRPGQGDLGNLATFDASLATAISGAWTLNTGLAVRYASEVAPGLKSTDTLVTVGFGYKF
jgi:putative salt-induced outer membrane protein